MPLMMTGVLKKHGSPKSRYGPSLPPQLISISRVLMFPSLYMCGIN